MFRYIAEVPKGEVARDDCQRRFLALHTEGSNVGTMLQLSETMSKQCFNIVLTT